MQLWFNFLGVFNTWLFKWCKVNCPCKLSLRTVILVGHSNLEFYQKIAYELGKFRIFLVAQYLSLNNFLLAAWSQVWGSFLTAMSTQVKLGRLQFQQFPYLSLCVLHVSWPPSTSGICPDTSYFAYTQRAACRRKNGKRKNDEMQAPAARIPATPSAFHTVCFHVKPAKHTGPHGLTPVSCAWARTGPGIYKPLPFL